MKQNRFRLIEKAAIAPSGKLWRMRFEAPGIEAAPGQFVNIAVDGHYLRRPVSVAEYSGDILTLIVQTVGEGTRILVDTPEGTSLDMLTGLGNRFDVPEEAEGKPVVLIGGGVGYAPLTGWLRHLVEECRVQPLAVFGFNGRDDVPEVHIREMREKGLPVEFCTMTGESGEKGNAIEVARRILAARHIEAAYFYACGPMPMMKAACGAFGCEGQLSLEARMGCGFGACMGCSIHTQHGPKRICKEGPVFKKSELI